MPESDLPLIKAQDFGVMGFVLTETQGKGN